MSNLVQNNHPGRVMVGLTEMRKHFSHVPDDEIVRRLGKKRVSGRWLFDTGAIVFVDGSRWSLPRFRRCLLRLRGRLAVLHRKGCVRFAG